jgi:hypothetical protein
MKPMTIHPSYKPRRPDGEMLTRASAQVARLPAVEARGEERRVVNLAADLRQPGSELVDVEVADVSTNGFMMRCPLDLEPGAMIWLKLAGTTPMKSEVIWVQDGRAGCRFVTPLYPALLDQIIENQPKPELKRLFAPPARLAEPRPQAQPDEEPDQEPESRAA